MTKISVLGTGHMGAALARTILNAGLSLTVYNRTPERTQPLIALGATSAATVASAIADSDISIFVMLHGKAVLEALVTVPAAAFSGKTIISAASATIEEGRLMREMVEQAGGTFADMSIEVGADALAEGQGVVSLGATEASFAALQPLFVRFLAEVKRVGEPGAARELEAVALVGSMLAGVNVAYMVAFAQKVGIAPEVYKPYIAMFEPAAAYVIDSMVAHNYDNIFASIENYVQGLTTSIENADALGIPSGVLRESLKLYSEAVAMGYAGKDGTAVLEALLK